MQAGPVVSAANQSRSLNQNTAPTQTAAATQTAAHTETAAHTQAGAMIGSIYDRSSSQAGSSRSGTGLEALVCRVLPIAQLWVWHVCGGADESRTAYDECAGECGN